MSEIELLASKLGVAAEYLWGALLRQAPISGMADLMQYALVAVLIYASARLWGWMYARVRDDGWDDFGYILPTAATVLSLLMVCHLSSRLSITIASFVNPEYWALHEVLQHVKK